MIGQTISHYKITEKLGEGGMGVVYKAEDTKLNRSVALKFLRSDVLEDEEHKERFLREAQAAAALNHPNISTIYEINEADGAPFIAMEFVEGETVKGKVKARPLPLEEVLDIAIQTAKGLQAAHEKAIVHRDIKSSNLIVTPWGQVKVMDFGLAQLAERSQLTKTATILGTPAYMSPEQAKKSGTDCRTDIWSLGVVIYEMVTAKLPFERERLEAVLYAIGNEEPEPVTALRAGVPMELEWIVGKALAKDADERYQHVEEMIVDLRGLQKKLKAGTSTILKTAPASAVAEAPSSVAAAGRPKSAGPMNRGWGRPLLWTALVLIGCALGVGVAPWFHSSDQGTELPPRRFTVSDPDFGSLLGAGTAARISPAGDAIAYIVQTGGAEAVLRIHDLTLDEKRELGSVFEHWEGPVWSPDGRFLSFTNRGELKKASVRGGPIVTVCHLPETGYPVAQGHTWSPDGGSIVFAAGQPLRLYEVAAGGGEPELLFEPPTSEADQDFVYPHFLPNKDSGRVFAYAMRSEEKSLIVVDELDGQRRTVLSEGTDPVYSPTGHLVYRRSSLLAGLMAVPFSTRTLQMTGEPFSLAAKGFSPSVAADGTLVYLEQRVGSKQLAWRDRKGKRLGSIGQPQADLHVPSISPDGQYVGVEGVEETTGADVWLHEVDRPVKRRLTVHPAPDSRAIWTPDGKSVAFWSQRNGDEDIFVIPADGSGKAELIHSSPGYEEPNDWSPNGKLLLFSGAGVNGLGYLQQKADAADYKPTRLSQFSQAGRIEWWGTFSPDGRYVAYCSNESGRFEVFVRPFPEGSKTQVTSSGGTQPRWSRDGKELFYVENDTLIAVAATTQPEFSMGSETRLFSSPNLAWQYTPPTYDVSADGQRFVLIEPVGEPRPPVIRVVQNWFEEFRERGEN